MKVVINACYGGFGLSPYAEVAYLKRKGKKAFFYTQDRSSGEGVLHSSYLRITAKEAAEELMYYTFSVDLGAQISSTVLDENMNDVYLCTSDLERSDPDLVAVVEELGPKADGYCAKLKVVEIPDGTAYKIEQYDGNEHIAETHQTWG
jgi:hypothetical protein